MGGAASGPDRGDDIIARVRPIDDQHKATLFGHAFGNPSADALRGAGHDDGAVRETRGHAASALVSAGVNFS